MRKLTAVCILVAVLTCILFNTSLIKSTLTSISTETELEADEQDGIKELQEYELETTKDPALGYIPKYRITREQKRLLEQGALRADGTNKVEGFIWSERGSYSDAVGASNGNGRSGTNVTSGRILSIWVDLADATNKTVWIGSADGGLWKTTDITAATPTWSPISDYFGSMAISSICQDPTNTNIMYFGTGEKTYNADAVRGGGVWKSTDHGNTWSLLTNTTNFYNVSKIICDKAGNLYVGTISGYGLLRSKDGGSSWSIITPTINAGGGGAINTPCVADMAYDNASDKLHVVMGYIPGSSSTIYEGYCYTTSPSTVSSSTWTAPVTSFITTANSMDNCAIACSGSTVYATPANSSDLVTAVYKSTDGGANWAATSTTPSNSGNTAYTNGQGWYCLGLAVDPTDANNAMVGSLNCYKTSNGGSTWSLNSVWVSGISGTVTQYIHADQHCMAWNGSQVLVASDGGLFYSSDGGTTFTDRNVNLRLKQFYSVAIHPTTINYFLAGAQDNGVHQFNGVGMTTSTEVTGGDGMFVAIDQDEASYQFGSYVYNHYRRSTDGGTTWSSFDFYKGNSTLSEFGSFVNAFDYDNTGNVLYAGADANEFFRWTTAQTLAPPSTYYKSGGAGFPTGVDIISVSNMGGGKVSAVKVSPYTSNKVYFGTNNGKLISVSSAKTIASGSSGTSLTGSSFPSGTISCINTGSTDNNLIVSFSNYGVNNIWVSTDGGANWTTVDGNLADMPVRWVMFHPDDNTKAIIATETGVYQTSLLNGASTVWTRESTFPYVRTDMLKYRSSDRLLVAATHGRGLWSTNIQVLLPVTLIDFSGNLNGSDIQLNWTTSMEQNSKEFEIEKSTDGIHFYKIGTVSSAGYSFSQANYSFLDFQVNDINYYRLNMLDVDGHQKTSKVIMVKGGNIAQNVWVTNPFSDKLAIRFSKPIQKLRMELLNASGTLIITKEISNPGQMIEWSIPLLINSGVYYLRLSDGNTVIVKKVSRN